MNTIIDTDALLGLFNTKDLLHEKAASLAKKLLKKKINTFVLPTTLCEFALVASGKDKIGMKEAQNAVSALLNSGIPVLDIAENLYPSYSGLQIFNAAKLIRWVYTDSNLSLRSITKQAVVLYWKQTSKEESLFDCYVMAAARERGINYIFSFDEGYKKKINGFRLVADLK